MEYPNLAPILNNLQVLILDVDGVLTAGGIIYNSSGEEEKIFDVKDGLGLVMLKGMNISTAIITGRSSGIVERRAGELGIDYVLQGYPIKLPAYEKLKRELSLPDIAFGFVGDDLIDLDVMRYVGFAAAPSDAHQSLKNMAHYVCRNRSGAGAVREIVDLIIAFRRAEFGALDYIPPKILEHWQDIIWERQTGNPNYGE
ncbi:hypothetical protein DRQ33_03080 [bacterium]|nr:MAG: hypothetical protein DRQ33_03080 [bacterium]